MSKSPTIAEFLRSFGGHWFTRMSGPMTVPFVIAALLAPPTWAKALFAILAIVCAIGSSYGIWSAERSKLVEAESLIDSLTWPLDRPKLSFHAWGKRQMSFMPPGSTDRSLMAEHGFYLANDGGAALEVTVESFRLTTDLLAVGATIPRVEGGDKDFVPVWIDNEVPLSKWGLDIALQNARQARLNSHELQLGDSFKVPVSVIYRDYNDLWYRSRATLVFTFEDFYDNRIEFTAVQQESLGTERPLQNTGSIPSSIVS